MENELIYIKEINLLRHILLTVKIVNILYCLYLTNLNYLVTEL